MKRILLILINTIFLICSISYGEAAFSFTKHFYKDTNYAINALGSTNIQESMDGYYSIFTHKINTIPLLICNACNTNINSNCAFISPYYSGDSASKNTGILSLYLIECILHNRTQPHYTAWILKLNTVEGNNNKYVRSNDFTTQTNVAAIYKEWWEKNKNYSLAEIRERDINPLEHTQYQWEGYTQHMHLAEFTFTNKTVIPEEYPKERKSILERLLSIFH